MKRILAAATLAALLVAPFARAGTVGGYPNATSPLNGTERILADQTVGSYPCVACTVNITPLQLSNYTAAQAGSFGLLFNNSGAIGGLAPVATGQYCLDWASLTAAPTLVTCTGGASTAFQVNGTALTSSTTVNFENSVATNGVTLTFTNPSAGNVQLGLTGTLNPAGGGTGLTTTPTNGQLLIGNGTGYTLAALTAGANMSITNGAGSISLAAIPSGSNTYVQFNSSGAFGGSTYLTWNGSSNVFNVGATTTPGTVSVGSLDSMIVNGTAIPVPGFALNSNIQGVIENHSYTTGTSAGAARIYLARSDGSITSPSIVVNGDHLGTIYGAGFNGTTNNYLAGGYMQFIVDGTPSSTAMPSDWVLALAGATGAPAQVMRAYSNGGVVVGSPTGGNQGAGTINAQGVYVNGTAVSATPPFSSITSGTNTTAAMVVGTGASLGVTGTGTISANQVNGAAVPASAALVATNASAQPTAVTLGNGFSISSGVLNATYAINAQTGTTYTIATTDCTGLVTFNNAAAVAVSVPAASATGFNGCSFDVQDLGAGAATLTPASGTINGAANLIVGQNYGCTLTSDGTNWQVSACTAVAPSSGGGITPSGSPAQYDTGVFASGTTLAGIAPGAAGTCYMSNGAAANPSFQTCPSGGTALNLQTFTTSGTWTKPSGTPQLTQAICIGGGGGGGSGAVEPSGTVAGGGSGGGGGATVSRFFATASLASTVTVTVGAGGTGGLAKTATSAGANGGSGGVSSFGALLFAYAGGGGQGGQTAAAASGGGGGGLAGSGGTFVGGSVCGGVAANGSTGNPPSCEAGGASGGGSSTTGSSPTLGGPAAFGGSGGGGGGGITTTPTASAGGTGGGNNALAGGAAGAIGAAGSPGSIVAGIYAAGTGGGGGGGSTTGNGGAGGAGALGAGGAGGGAALNGTGSSGAGGNGGNGECVVVTTY